MGVGVGPVTGAASYAPTPLYAEVRMLVVGAGLDPPAAVGMDGRNKKSSGMIFNSAKRWPGGGLPGIADIKKAPCGAFFISVASINGHPER